MLATVAFPPRGAGATASVTGQSDATAMKVST